MSDKQIDARGQKCPMPLLMAKRGLRDMAPGAVLELLATDPGSTKDFQSFKDWRGMVLNPKPSQTVVFVIVLPRPPHD